MGIKENARTEGVRRSIFLKRSLKRDLFFLMFAPLASCVPSGSAMHDVCVTCAEKMRGSNGRERP